MHTIVPIVYKGRYLVHRTDSLTHFATATTDLGYLVHVLIHATTPQRIRHHFSSPAPDLNRCANTLFHAATRLRCPNRNASLQLPEHLLQRLFTRKVRTRCWVTRFLQHMCSGYKCTGEMVVDPRIDRYENRCITLWKSVTTLETLANFQHNNSNNIKTELVRI
jgi:hypothetical protein